MVALKVPIAKGSQAASGSGRRTLSMSLAHCLALQGCAASHPGDYRK